MKPCLEDFGNIQGTIDLTLDSNYHTESMARVLNIAHWCMNPKIDIQPTMTVVVNEIVDALQLEEGHMGDKGATESEILQCPSQSEACTGSLGESALKESLLSFVDKLDSNCEHMCVDTKGDNQQQPQTSNANYDGSRLVLELQSVILILQQKLTGGLIGLQSKLWGLFKGLFVYLGPFPCRDLYSDSTLSANLASFVARFLSWTLSDDKLSCKISGFLLCNQALF